MLFNSYIFIFLFLPVALIGYFGLNKIGKFTPAKYFLVGMSLWFYAYFNISYLWIIVASIAVNYFCHRLMLAEKLQENTGLKRCVFLAGLIFNIGLLFYYKYFNFFIDNVNSIFNLSVHVKSILLPLGISFYTFQQISFIIDSYKGHSEKYSFDEYALFVSFFPQLIAGPIVLHSETVPQFRDKAKRVINYDNVYDGIQYFVLGLAKKVLIADSFGRAVDWGYENVLSLNSISAALVILLYTLQIYFDFSGYCDMAIGLGKFFNIDLAVNFNSPYKALSVSEFWKRWHITLTRFLTTYVYIPLGGNRKGIRRTCINVLIVFALSGLWHGADWTFVLWGIMHGIVMVFERLFDKYLKKVPAVIRWVGTFGFVNFAWVFFRADFFRQALSVFKGLLLGGIGNVQTGMVSALVGDGKEILFGQLGITNTATGVPEHVIMWVWIILLLLVTILGHNTHELVKAKHQKKGYGIVLVCIALLSIVSMSGVSKFLYFNF